MEQKLAEHDRRLSALESGQNELRGDLRIAEVRREHIDEQFQRVNNRFNKLDQNISKLVWLVIAAILGGVMSFIMKGGLAVVT